jgi:hypothetical protein
VSADPLAAFLDLLFGAEPAGAFVEVRWRLRDRGGMGQLWRPVERKITAIDSIRSIGAKTDCYVGCAPRTRRYGGKDAIERAHVLWADCDSPDAIAALERFEASPSLVIRSGSGRHAYWSIFPPADTAEVEQANRRLAHALGADMAATDCARILRPPATHNFKTGEPVPVEIDHLAFEVYALEDVVGELADPVAERPPRRTVAAPTAHDDALLTIPPRAYVELLTGQEVGRDAKVNCPFHRDNTPSLHVYERAKTPGSVPGWKCYGCGRAGSVIDFAASLYGLEPRGRGYHEIRRRLAADLLGRKAA